MLLSDYEGRISRGILVKLVCGGPIMAVVDWRYDTGTTDSDQPAEVDCIWFDKNDVVHQRTFPVELIVVGFDLNELVKEI